MRKTLWLSLMTLASLSLALLAREWLYRSQPVDMYRPELHTFTPPQVLASNAKPTLLVMGDSFTASRTSYAGILQDTLQEWRVINAAVSGTGALQALYMAPKRFAQFPQVELRSARLPFDNECLHFGAVSEWTDWLALSGF
jgi:hypothetical protein